MAYSRCYASLLRHLQAFWMGIDLDEESGLYHTAHVVWNAMALLQYQLMRTGEDDRPYVKKIHTDPETYRLQDLAYEVLKDFHEEGEDYLTRGDVFDCRD
jgi:hypothetical protein